MKKSLTLLILSLLVVTVANATEPFKFGRGRSVNNQRSDDPDYLVKRGDKVKLKRNGSVNTLENEMLLGDGSIIYPDGTIKKKNGSTYQLKDGEAIDLDGKRLAEVPR